MKLILKKRILLRMLTFLFILMVFAIGWLYLEYMFFANRSLFDFSIYLGPSENIVSQENSVNSTVIVFSKKGENRPVELYVSNCPKYSVCTLSVSNAVPTFTSELAVSTSTLTPAGTYTINIFATGGGVKKSSTYYLEVKPKECTCTEWVSAGCGGMCGSDMYLSRVCAPRRCDIESRCAYNSSCVEDFNMESIPVYIRVFDQRAMFTIKVTSINNFSDYVYLSTTSCPPGSVCSYLTNPVFVPGGGVSTSYLDVRTAVGVATGDFNITTVGIGNETIHSAVSRITIA